MASYVFPKVEPADIQRSNRNLSLYKPFTISAGVLAPVLTVDMLPGDWMRINTIATVQSLPMIAPVRGRWKCSFDYYYEPWSNLYGWMDNNTKLSIQSIVENKRWTYKVGIDQDSLGLESLKNLPKVGRSSLLDFLGIPVGYYGSIESGSSGSINLSSSEHPAEGLLTYIDIIRNYYINNQIGSIPFVRMASNFRSDRGGRGVNSYESFTSASLDSLFAKLRYDTASASLSIGSVNSYSPASTLIFSALGATINELGYGFEDWNTTLLGGLFLRNYRMDLLRGILSSSVGSYASKINVQTLSGVSFVTADDIYFGNKLQQFINRIDISGGRFSDWIRTRWNVDTGTQVDRPIHLGSHSLWLNTIDVVATAAGQSGEDVNNPNSIVGQQVGYQVGKMDSGSGRDRQRAVVIKSKQYGTLQCIFSITPDVVYSQGIELNNLKTTFADIYDPAFKQLGFQDVSKIELDVFPWTDEAGRFITDNNRLVGKRIAWSEYMASLNRCHGDFAYGESLDYWVNNRVYTVAERTYGTTPPDWFVNGYQLSSDEDINDVWLDFISSSMGKRLYMFNNDTYVYPHMWNNAFAIKSISQMNYMVDVYFQIDASRNLGKRIMPKM